MASAVDFVMSPYRFISFTPFLISLPDSDCARSLELNCIIKPPQF